MFRESKNLTNYLKLKMQLCIKDCKAFLEQTALEQSLVPITEADHGFLQSEFEKSDPIALESFLLRLQYQGLDQSLGDYVEALFQKALNQSHSIFVDLDLEHEALDRLALIYQKINSAFCDMLMKRDAIIAVDLCEVAFHRGLESLIEIAHYRINLALAELISLEGYTILAVNHQYIEVKRKVTAANRGALVGTLKQTTRQWTQYSRGLAVNYQFDACS